MGYFLLAFGVVGLVLSFVAGTGLLRVLCGGLALTAAILFVVMVGNGLPSGSSTSVTDLIGAGPWVTGISGLVLIGTGFYWSGSATSQRP